MGFYRLSTLPDGEKSTMGFKPNAFTAFSISSTVGVGLARDLGTFLPSARLYLDMKYSGYRTMTFCFFAGMLPALSLRSKPRL